MKGTTTVATSLVSMNMTSLEDAAATTDLSFLFVSSIFLSSSCPPSPIPSSEIRQICRAQPWTVINCFYDRFLSTASPTDTGETKMGPNVKEILLDHSRYIRDVLAPVVAREGGRLDEKQINALKMIFASLSTVKITVELLRYSRIEKALGAMTVEGSGWPAEYTLLAEALWNAWENSVGPLRNIRADLWGPGGRLEGIKKLDTLEEEEATLDERRGSRWSVEHVEDRFKAYKHGHIGFNVGDWWIKPSAAYRDGIIDETHNSISADDSAAYAIRLDEDQESTGAYQDLPNAGVEPATIQYRPPPDEPSIQKLTKAILTREPIRVLRSWKLKSPRAPKAGLRYDGLYRVVGFGVKLEQVQGKDVLKHTFQLSRQIDPPQDPLEKALAYPMADQMDDWKDYQRLKAEHEGGGLMNMLLATKSEVHIPRESGYFTANPSENGARQA